MKDGSKDERRERWQGVELGRSHGVAAGKGSRAHRAYGRVPAPPGSHPARIGTPAYAGAQPMPDYPDLFGGLIPATDSSSASGGEIPGPLRMRLEQQLGHDLSGVRIHTGSESNATAAALSARAYTRGQDIHFAAGQYDPSSQTGQHLLAHEVAHTIQQRGVSAAPQCKPSDGVDRALSTGTLSEAGDVHEREADAFADAFVSGSSHRPAISAGSAPVGAVARKVVAGSGARRAFLIVSAWSADGKRLQLWHGPAMWSGRLRVYTGRIRAGTIAWRGARVDHPIEVAGQSLTSWLPAEATKVIVSAGRDYGMLDTSIHEPGGGRHRNGRRRRTLRASHKRELTGKDLYGALDRKNRQRKQALARERAAVGERRWRESLLVRGTGPFDRLRDALETAPEKANTYEAGVAAGVFEGAYKSIADLIQSAKDSVAMAVKIAVNLLRGDGAKIVFDLANGIATLARNRNKMVRLVGRELARRLTHKDDYQRGKYHGQLAGYLVTELAFLFATSGAGVAMKAGKFARLLSALRMVNSALDPLVWASSLARRMRLPRKLADQLGDARGPKAKAAPDTVHLGMDGGRKNVGGPYVDPRKGTDEPREFIERRKLLPTRKLELAKDWKTASKALDGNAKGVPLGRRLKNAADGHEILSRLAAGDASALHKLGIDDYPKHLDTTGREWALVQTRDGFVVFAGRYDGVGLPADVRVLAHTHPGPKPAAKFFDDGGVPAPELPVKTGDGVSYEAVLQLPNYQTMGLTPSAVDIHGISDGTSHVIYTHFVHRGGGKIGNPTKGDTAPRIVLHLENTKVVRWRPRTKEYWYEVEVIVKDTAGADLWRGTMYNKWHAISENKGPVHPKKPAELKRPAGPGEVEP